MAKAIYEGVGGVARKVKNAYEGVGGVARRVKNGFIGVGGVARQFFSADYETFMDIYKDGILTSLVIEYEYEKLPSDSDTFDDYTYLYTYIPSSNNTFVRNTKLASTSHTDIKSDRLVYHGYIYFFCSTLEGATALSELIKTKFTKVTGMDTDRGYSYGVKTIDESDVYCYTSVCSEAGIQIPYYQGASSKTYWEAYKTSGYSDKYVVRVATGNFLGAWHEDGDYPRDLLQITFS